MLGGWMHTIRCGVLGQAVPNSCLDTSSLIKLRLSVWAKTLGMVPRAAETERCGHRLISWFWFCTLQFGERTKRVCMKFWMSFRHHHKLACCQFCGYQSLSLNGENEWTASISLISLTLWYHYGYQIDWAKWTSSSFRHIIVCGDINPVKIAIKHILSGTTPPFYLMLSQLAAICNFLKKVFPHGIQTKPWFSWIRTETTPFGPTRFGLIGPDRGPRQLS